MIWLPWSASLAPSSKGSAQIRIEPIIFKQVRRNNRSLEKFYDAKYIDIRTCKKASAGELNCGRRTRNKSKKAKNAILIERR